MILLHIKQKVDDLNQKQQSSNINFAYRSEQLAKQMEESVYYSNDWCIK